MFIQPCELLLLILNCGNDTKVHESYDMIKRELHKVGKGYAIIHGARDLAHQTHMVLPNIQTTFTWSLSFL